MGVYQPLEKFLKQQSFAEVPMTFGDIAAVLGRALPKSAFHHRPWWANEAAGHSHAKAWLNAGFETAQVDMAGQKLVFRRIAARPAAPPSRGLAERPRDFRRADSGNGLFGAMKGTFTILPDAATSTFDTADQAALEAGIDRTADLIEAGLRAR